MNTMKKLANWTSGADTMWRRKVKIQSRGGMYYVSLEVDGVAGRKVALGVDCDLEDAIEDAFAQSRLHG